MNLRKALGCIVLLGSTLFAGMLASCSTRSGNNGNESLRIYEMIAGSGSFTAVAGDSTGTKFQLSLNNVPGSVLYFTDRPAREAGYDTVGNVMNTIWPKVYASVAPNVLLRATIAGQGVITLFGMLEQPAYNAATGQLNGTITCLNGNRMPVADLAVTDVKLVILNNAPSALPEDWSQLMSGDAGTFTPSSSNDGTYTFSIQQAHDSVFSYTNAPARKSTLLTVKEFMQGWQARFGTTPPNASIAYDPGNNVTGGVQIVTLTNPLYDEATGSISFTARVLYGTTPIGAAGLRVTGPSLIIDGSYSEDDLKKLLQTRECENCTLNEADLHGADLSGAKLKQADLTNANLTGTNLRNADLTSANLTGATVDKANLVGATLLNVIGPTSMQGRVINLVNGCGINIWAAASGNTMATQCRSSNDCNGGTCPPLTDACSKDATCHNLCTTYPCGGNADCTETNTYCGGIPSYNQKIGTGCTKDADCGANLFCNAASGQCGWKNCTYVPIPVEKEQIVAPVVSCTSNKDCSRNQFCYTTTSTTGRCATLPGAAKGNSWQLKPTETTPLFIPTPWAGRFWPRTGCSSTGSACDPRYAGTDAQCGATAVNPEDRKLLQPLANPQPYSVKCRNDSNCGPSPINATIVGGTCNLTDTPAFDPGQQHKISECTPGDDSTCDAVKGRGSNYICIPEKVSTQQGVATIGVCGYRSCTAYQCSGQGEKLCMPATFSCDTGTCYDEQSPAGVTPNCRQSGLNSPTLAELNMFLPSKGIDFYDISLVDGANVPVQIAPVATTYARGTSDEIQTDKTCSSNSDCWKANLDYNWVCDTGKGQCVNKFYCGSPGCVSDCSSYGRGLTDASAWGGRNLALSRETCPQELQLTNSAGAYVGCLSPLKACAPDHKGDPLRTGLSCDANLDMYQCTGATYANSCYTTGVGTSCCGCPDWMPKEFCAVGVNANPSWVSVALPYYKKFHTASPNAYTYPYDDKSGTFTCRGTSDTVNVNYNITFCPK